MINLRQLCSLGLSTIHRPTTVATAFGHCAIQCDPFLSSYTSPSNFSISTACPHLSVSNHHSELPLRHSLPANSTHIHDTPSASNVDFKPSMLSGLTRLLASQHNQTGLKVRSHRRMGSSGTQVPVIKHQISSQVSAISHHSADIHNSLSLKHGSSTRIKEACKLDADACNTFSSCQAY